MYQNLKNNQDNCEVKQLKVKPQSYSNQDLSGCQDSENKENPDENSNMSIDTKCYEDAKKALFKKSNIPQDIENHFYNEYYSMNMTDNSQRIVLGDLENKLNIVDGNLSGLDNASSLKVRVMQLEHQNDELKKKTETIEMETFDQLKNTFDHVEGKFYQEVDNLKATNSKLQLNLYKSENELTKLKSALQEKNRQYKDLEQQFMNSVSLGFITGNEWSTLCNELYQNFSNSKKKFYEQCQENKYRKNFDDCYNNLYESVNAVIDKINKKNVETEKSKYSCLSNMQSRRSRGSDNLIMRRNNSMDLNNRNPSFYNNNDSKKDLKSTFCQNENGMIFNENPNSRNFEVKKEFESGYKMYETNNSCEAILNDVEKDALKAKLQVFSECFIKKVVESTTQLQTADKLSKGYESQRVHSCSNKKKILETPLSKVQIEKQT